ncbi:hypothetical protein R3P38DRAFT_2778637 [Favolaschia claudopus]|uniref:Uncharacterized protein n=1 Tax=Favolaschia claudopus TaxID=2862362 RepID=A0AAW0BKR0_9AGAR
MNGMYRSRKPTPLPSRFSRRHLVLQQLQRPPRYWLNEEIARLRDCIPTTGISREDGEWKFWRCNVDDTPSANRVEIDGQWEVYGQKTANEGGFKERMRGRMRLDLIMLVKTRLRVNFTTAPIHRVAGDTTLAAPQRGRRGAKTDREELLSRRVGRGSANADEVAQWCARSIWVTPRQKSRPKRKKTRRYVARSVRTSRKAVVGRRNGEGQAKRGVLDETPDCGSHQVFVVKHSYSTAPHWRLRAAALHKQVYLRFAA